MGDALIDEAVTEERWSVEPITKPEIASEQTGETIRYGN